MHFVVGGAFNGKAKWVKQQYEQASQSWHSAYHPAFQKASFEQTETFQACTVLEGIEQYIKTYVQHSSDTETMRRRFRKQLDDWLHWESEAEERTLILIGTDLSKGIVPIDRTDRTWRDITGWCYQDITERAERVDIIWYGISQRLK